MAFRYDTDNLEESLTNDKPQSDYPNYVFRVLVASDQLPTLTRHIFEPESTDTKVVWLPAPDKSGRNAIETHPPHGPSHTSRSGRYGYSPDVLKTFRLADQLGNILTWEATTPGRGVLTLQPRDTSGRVGKFGEAMNVVLEPEGKTITSYIQLGTRELVEA